VVIIVELTVEVAIGGGTGFTNDGADGAFFKTRDGGLVGVASGMLDERDDGAVIFGGVFTEALTGADRFGRAGGDVALEVAIAVPDVDGETTSPHFIQNFPPVCARVS
jgi:hypothetical protein